MTKNTKFINFIKAIFIIIVFISAIFVTDRVLMLKSEDGYTQIQSLYKQKKNTVDALFLGSSKVYCQIDTGVLWDDFGISGFDLGGAEAPTWNSYYYMKEALKTQKPKVIMYDASIIAYRQDVLYQPEVWAVTNNYGMHWNMNRIQQLRANTENFKEFKRLLFPLGIMHSRYKELTQNDFNDENNSINYKGFDYRNTTVEYETPDVSGMTEQFVFDEKHEIYLRKMIELARENDIPFIVMVTPYVVTPGEQGYFNYLEEVCKQEGVTYIDFNKMYDELQLDFKRDMAENIHVNFSGSKKLTDYLGNYIVSNYDVTDHRGDPKYSSWDIDAEINRRNREEIGDLPPQPAPEE